MSEWLNNTKRIHDMRGGYHKPCQALGWCPYGQLVEAFPIHEMAKAYAVEHGKYVRWVNRETGAPMEFMVLGVPGTWGECSEGDEGATPDINWAVGQVDEIYSCNVFGHDCPVFYMAEPFEDDGE